MNSEIENLVADEMKKINDMNNNMSNGHHYNTTQKQNINALTNRYLVKLIFLCFFLFFFNIFI
jgi:hypothetical protein